MQHRTYELWIAAFLTLLVTAVYLAGTYFLGGIPRASGWFGHGIGVLGFVLMIATETLYSFRKRQKRASWGRMSTWLQFHIITGIVGPYMVLLHTSWQYNGLAGIAMLLTAIIVLSGFIGRYIYTAIPRTVDGAEMEAAEIRSQITHLESESQKYAVSQPHGKILKQLKHRQFRLQNQMNDLANTRRLLAAWHTIHVPIGAALFVAAFVHAVAAFYFAWLP